MKDEIKATLIMLPVVPLLILAAVLFIVTLTFATVLTLCRRQQTPKRLHISRAPLWIMASLLFSSGAAHAAEMSSVHVQPVDLPAQVFTLLGEMPSHTLWFLLIALALLHAITLKLVMRQGYKSGYSEGYQDATAVITELGEDIATGIERRLTRGAITQG